MNTRHLLLCTLLGLSACDAPPSNGPKVPRAEQANVVETALANRRDVTRTIERNGNLRALREVPLSVQQEGLLLSLPFQEGDRVSEGTILAQLDDTLLLAQLKKSQAQRHQAEQDLKRLQQLQNRQLVAEEELARAATLLDVARADEEELRIRLQQTRILAPFDGIISQRLVEPGSTLSRFSHVLTLIDTRSLITELTLSEMVLPWLQVGDTVTLTIDALGSQPYSGTLERIHPVVDEASRQGIIEVILKPPPAGARPGQLCRVALQLRSRDRLLVPYNALRRDTRGEFLYIVNDRYQVERRAIISGVQFQEHVEILHGLNAGERIVTRGFLGLSEGSKVTLANHDSVP